jgi:hypothetical protein
MKRLKKLSEWLYPINRIKEYEEQTQRFLHIIETNKPEIYDKVKPLEYKQLRILKAVVMWKPRWYVAMLLSTFTLPLYVHILVCAIPVCLFILGRYIANKTNKNIKKLILET